MYYVYQYDLDEPCCPYPKGSKDGQSRTRFLPADRRVRIDPPRNHAGAGTACEELPFSIVDADVAVAGADTFEAT